MNSFLLRSASVLSLAAASLAAQAVTLTFEGLAGTGTNQGSYTQYGSVVTDSGYTLTSTSNFYSRNAGTSFGVYTGSIALGTVSSTPITLTRSDGGAFDLASVLLANDYRQGSLSGGSTLAFVGTKVGGGTVSQAYTTPSDDDAHTLALVGFTNLTSVSLPVDAYPYYQFDNIVVNAANPTPEPSALAALGLGAVAFVKRRKKG